jgi:hypothetical protein
VIAATHPATEASAKIGTTRGEVVYELFYTALPQGAFPHAFSASFKWIGNSLC